MMNNACVNSKKDYLFTSYIRDGHAIYNFCEMVLFKTNQLDRILKDHKSCIIVRIRRKSTYSLDAFQMDMPLMDEINSEVNKSCALLFYSRLISKMSFVEGMN